MLEILLMELLLMHNKPLLTLRLVGIRLITVNKDCIYAYHDV